MKTMMLIDFTRNLHAYMIIYSIKENTHHLDESSMQPSSRTYNFYFMIRFENNTYIWEELMDPFFPLNGEFQMICA